MDEFIHCLCYDLNVLYYQSSVLSIALVHVSSILVCSCFPFPVALTFGPGRRRVLYISVNIGRRPVVVGGVLVLLQCRPWNGYLDPAPPTEVGDSTKALG